MGTGISTTDREPAPTPAATLRRSLAALELAALRYRGAVRRRLNVGEVELSALLSLAHHGGLEQRQLAEMITLSRSGAGALVQRLEQDGLVERRTQPGDRRLRFVELSATGRERVGAAYRELDAASERLLAERPAAELEALASIVDALVDATRAALGDEPPELPPSDAHDDPIWRRWG